MGYNLDLQQIADELEFDLEDVEMLLEVFLEGAFESLDALKNALDQNDLDGVFRAAHSIKGSAANLTLNDISELAKEIELNAREGASFNYKQKYEELEQLIKSI